MKLQAIYGKAMKDIAAIYVGSILSDERLSMIIYDELQDMVERGSIERKRDADGVAVYRYTGKHVAPVERQFNFGMRDVASLRKARRKQKKGSQ